MFKTRDQIRDQNVIDLKARLNLEDNDPLVLPGGDIFKVCEVVADGLFKAQDELLKSLLNNPDLMGGAL
jgi:hypothetical protein